MQKLSRFKKIILFFNASSFRLASLGSSNDDFFGKNHMVGIVLNWCVEFFLFKLLPIYTDKLSTSYFKILFLTPFILHFSIDHLFRDDLKLIEKNYKHYYQKPYFVGYCILSTIGVFYGIYYLFR